MTKTTTVLLGLFTFLLALLPAVAQGGAPVPNTGAELDIWVTFDNDHPVPEMYRVQLLNTQRIPIATTITNGRGEAIFPNIREGGYHLAVSGPNVETTETSFAIYRGELSHNEYVRVNRRGDAAPSSNEASVSRATLDIPDKARKEFEKGSAAFKKQDFAQAREKFQKAVELYPRYSLALENLGVLAMKENKVEDGERYFNQAITADPQEPTAYVQLARSEMLRKHYAEAEPLLLKVTSITPLDPEALTMLAASELYLGKTEEAVATAKKVHSVPHEHFANSHLLAAQGLMNEKKFDLAADELRLFLKESPDDPNAKSARAALQSIENKAN